MQDTLDSWSNRKYINHAAILRPPKSERNLEECGEGGGSNGERYGDGFEQLVHAGK